MDATIEPETLSLAIKRAGLYPRNFFDIGGVPHPTTISRFIAGKTKDSHESSHFYYHRLQRFLDNALELKVFPIPPSVVNKKRKIRGVVKDAFQFWESNNESLIGYKASWQ